jgi:hypothetical protein
VTIALRSAHGTAQLKANSATRGHGLTTADVLRDDAALMGVVTDNTVLVDGPSNAHVSCADTQGNYWVKVYEFTNSPTGVAADGVTTSLWLCPTVTTRLVSGTDIVTVTLAATCFAKCSGVVSYSKAPGKVLAVDGFVGAVSDAATTGPLKTLSGLVNVQHLYFAVDGWETTQTGFGQVQDADYASQWNNGSTGSANDTNIKIAGAHRIFSAVTDTHQMSSALTADSAGILAAFSEQPKAGNLLNTADSLRLGSSVVDKAFVGTTKVWG